jgi:hypothetical protein
VICEATEYAFISKKIEKIRSTKTEEVDLLYFEPRVFNAHAKVNTQRKQMHKDRD